MEKEQEKAKTLTVQQYFDQVKEAKQKMTSDDLAQMAESALKLLQRFVVTKQTTAAQRVVFNVQNLEKEKQLLDLGIDTFIYKSVLDEYIEGIAPKEVKVTDLSNYLRVIPDELIKKIEETQDLFTNYFVVFTDYTGREERRVTTEQRNRDPILLGAFIKRDEQFGNHNFCERMYYLGDWVDEQCDLTLDKLISEYKEAKGYSPVSKIRLPQTEEELQKYITEQEKPNV